MKQRALAITKISRPRLRNVLARKRLFLLLDRCDAGVTWISAPAGSGKTELVSSWLEARRHPCLWYQMDAGDADLASFFYYLGLAAKQAAPRAKRPLPLLTSEYLMDVPTFSRRYFESLCASLRLPCFLVFDNYQLVPPQSSLHSVLASGIAAMPEGVQVLCLSRSGPPSAFSGLTAGNRLELFGWDDLRLSPGESRAIAKLHAGNAATRNAVDWMHERAQGWAAGLVLMARAAKAGRIDPGAVDGLPPEQIFEYFATELFSAMDEKERNFLVKTSVLSSMSPEVAAQLTGDGGAGAILEGLHRRNYFTVKNRMLAVAYQYHPLFRQFLQDRLGDALSPGELQRHRARAAGILENAGQIEYAVKLYRMAEAWDDLERVITGNARALLDQGRRSMLGDWLAGIPAGVTERNPWIGYWKGACAMPADPARSREDFERAYLRFKEAGDENGRALAWAAVVETYVLEWSDFRPLDRWIDEAASFFREHTDPLPPETGARLAAAMFCALMYRQPDHPDLPLWEDRLKRIILAADDVRVKLLLSSHLILYYAWWQGDQAEAALLVRSLRGAAEAPGNDPLSVILWRSIEAAYLWMVAENGVSIRAVTQGLSVADRSGIHFWDVMLMAQASFASLTEGDLETASPYLRRMEFIFSTSRSLDLSHYHYHLSFAALLQGNLGLAREHVQTSVRLAEDSGVPFILAFALMGLAEVLMEEGKHREAARHLARAREIGRNMRSRSVEYQYQWLDAVRRFALGDDEAGLQALRRHLAVSREYGILNHAWWRSPVMARLYARALDAGIEVDHVQRQIRKRNIVHDEPPLHVESWPWRLKIFTLGGFRLRTDGAAVMFPKKTQKKPLQLLKVLVARGGRPVREEELADLLWPDSEGDAGRKSVNVTVVRLRSLLGVKEAVRFSEGSVSLDPRFCWVDAWAFERILGSAGSEKESAPARQKKKKPPSDGHLDQALALYSGPFLPGEQDAWTLSYRERLRGKLVRQVETAGRELESCGLHEKAIAWYRKGIDADELAEPFYQRVIACYQKLGRRAEALSVYQCCRERLAAYGIEPSPETEAFLAARSQASQARLSRETH